MWIQITLVYKTSSNTAMADTEKPYVCVLQAWGGLLVGEPHFELEPQDL